MLPAAYAGAHAVATVFTHAFGLKTAAGVAGVAAGAASVAPLAAVGHAAQVAFAAKAAAATHALTTASAATAASHASVAGAAATGAATSAMTAAPVVITSSMRRRDKRPNTRAVGRILQVELERLRTTAWGVGSDDPVEVAKRLQEGAVNRGPIIKWALNIWIRGELGMRQAQYKGLTIVASLRALELELASQIRFGFRHAPLRVLRLAGSVIFLTLFAWLSQLPGGFAMNQRLRNTWPKTVEHLADILEANLAVDPVRGLETTDGARRLGIRWRRWLPLPATIERELSDPLEEFQIKPLLSKEEIMHDLFGEPFYDPAILQPLEPTTIIKALPAAAPEEEAPRPRMLRPPGSLVFDVA